ncbi:MAG: CHASE domain-containing protein [Deltaproteobacteria bacterium]
MMITDRNTNSASLPDSRKSDRFQQLLNSLPIAILMITLAITIFLWKMYDDSLRTRSEMIFSDRTDEIINRITMRMHDHEQVLRGAAGLFAVNEGATRTDWRHYVSALQLDENHPGILGVGFSKWLTTEEKDANIRKIRSEGFLEYNIRPEGERSAYTSIIYLEPFNWRNQRAFGYDMYSEPLRRAAMDRARDENIATIAAKIILVQETDKDKQSGMLMYVPIYRQGVALDSLESRRKAFIGFAYSPIRMNDFVYGTLGKLPEETAFEINVGGKPTSDNLMFSSILAEKLTLPENFKPAIISSKSIQAYGCTWQFTFKTLPAFNNELNQKQSYMMLLTGILISLLISYLALLTLKTKKQAIELAEEKITNLSSRLALAADSAHIGVWDWQVPQNQLIWDKWMYALYGLRAEDFSGAYQAWQKGLHPDDKARGDEAIQQALRGENEFDIEFRVVWPSGEVRHIKANALVLRDDAGNPLRMIGINYDITAKNIAEEQLHEQTEMLELEIAQRQRTQEELAVKQMQLEAVNSSLQERINEAIAELRQKDQLMISQSRQAAMGEMIGNIAHQWRQPLNALAMVLGNIQLAYQYNDLTAGYLQVTVDNGNRLIQKMSTTINDFRNFFVPDKEMVSFSAREQISHAVALVEAGLASHNITIQLEVDQDIMLTGFPNEYSQVLLNLLSNSREAIKDSGALEGHITIRLYEFDGQGFVSVGDNGGGIADDVIDKVFEPYFSTKQMGTGIGLYMSKMIIERSMNGTIEAHNIEGGAEFVVVTPLERRLP